MLKLADKANPGEQAFIRPVSPLRGAKQLEKAAGVINHVQKSAIKPSSPERKHEKKLDVEEKKFSPDQTIRGKVISKIREEIAHVLNTERISDPDKAEELRKAGKNVIKDTYVCFYDVDELKKKYIPTDLFKRIHLLSPSEKECLTYLSGWGAKSFTFKDGYLLADSLCKIQGIDVKVEKGMTFAAIKDIPWLKSHLLIAMSLKVLNETVKVEYKDTLTQKDFWVMSQPC